MLYRHLIEGSVYVMLPIYLFWMVNIILTVILFATLIAKKDANLPRCKLTSEVILFTGSFAFLMGIFWQILGLRQMLEVIGELGNISPTIIAKGLLVSSHSTLYGLALFIVSLLAWFIAKRLMK